MPDTNPSSPLVSKTRLTLHKSQYWVKEGCISFARVSEREVRGERLEERGEEREGRVKNYNNNLVNNIWLILGFSDFGLFGFSA